MYQPVVGRHVFDVYNNDLDIPVVCAVAVVIISRWSNEELSYLEQKVSFTSDEKLQ